MFSSPHDSKAEQALMPDGELRVVENISGHLGPFGVAPTYVLQIDRYSAGLLAAKV